MQQPKVELITTTQLADHVRIPRSRIYTLVQKNQIPFVRLGQECIRFDKRRIQEIASIIQKSVRKKDMMRVSEVARLWKVSPSFVYGCIKRGELESEIFGKRTYVPTRSVEQFREDGEVERRTVSQP